MFAPLNSIHARCTNLDINSASLTDQNLQYAKAALAALYVVRDRLSAFDASEKTGARQGLTEAMVQVYNADSFNEHYTKVASFLEADMDDSGFADVDWTDGQAAMFVFTACIFIHLPPAVALHMTESVVSSIIS